MIWYILTFVIGFIAGSAFLIYTDLWLEVVFILETFYENVIHFVRHWRRSMSFKNIYGDEMIYTTMTDVYGGQDLRINMNSVAKENLQWLQNFRYEYEKEKKLREENLAVKNAYEQYQIIKALAQKESV